MSEFVLRSGEMKVDMLSLYGTKTALYGVRAELAVQILRLRMSGSSTAVYALRNKLSRCSKKIGNEITNINSIVNSGNTICSKAKAAETAAKLEMSGMLDIIKITWPFVGATAAGGQKNNNLGKSFLWTLYKSTTIGTITAPFLSNVVGLDTEPKNIFKNVTKSGAAAFKTVAGFVDKGWKEGAKDFLGLTKYCAKGIEPGKTFSGYLKDSLAKEINAYKPQNSGIIKNAGTIAKWAGVIAEVGSEGIENYDEYKEGKISGGRAVAETVIESGVDIGMGIAASAVTGAALAAAGIAAPAVAVAAISGVAVWGANKLVEHFTGKDIGEHISDFYCDHAEKAVKTIKRVGSTVVNWAKSIWPFK